jgi:hypothetical protein
MKVGDLVEYVGEYHIVLADGNVEWVISSIEKTGLITELDDHSIVIASDTHELRLNRESIQRGTCNITIVSSA